MRRSAHFERPSLVGAMWANSSRDWGGKAGWDVQLYALTRTAC